MWHIQGQNNERVAATAHWVHSTANIPNCAPPTISFRRRINPEEAGLARGYITSPPYATEIYGADDGDSVIQGIGDVVFTEGRTVGYPNTLQTRLNGFGLADGYKSEHCRILTFLILDPKRRDMSTAMDPCQRRDWWSRRIRQRSPRMRRLPTGVLDKFISMVDGYPLSPEEAQNNSDEIRGG